MRRKSRMILLLFLLPWAPGVLGGTEGRSDKSLESAAKALDRTQDDADSLKQAWEKERMEVTLYEKRLKRALDRLSKAASGAKGEALDRKQRAEVEFQLAVEKRKLAYNRWKAAQLRAAARKSELEALEQEKDIAAIREQIQKLQEKLADPATKKD